MTSQSMVEGDRVVLKFETIYVCVYSYLKDNLRLIKILIIYLTKN